ncbi:MAG: Sec-independent protein translocase protein TatB [Holosporales bacterium]
MFSLGGWFEFIIVAVVALVLIGPKELPVVLRSLGRLVQKWRRLTFDIRQQVSHLINEGEFEEYRQHAEREAQQQQPTPRGKRRSATHSGE